MVIKIRKPCKNSINSFSKLGKDQEYLIVCPYCEEVVSWDYCYKFHIHIGKHRCKIIFQQLNFFRKEEAIKQLEALEVTICPYCDNPINYSVRQSGYYNYSKYELHQLHHRCEIILQLINEHRKGNAIRKMVGNKKYKILFARLKNYIRQYGSVELSKLFVLFKSWTEEFRIFPYKSFSLSQTDFRTLLQEGKGFEIIDFYFCYLCGSQWLSSWKEQDNCNVVLENHSLVQIYWQSDKPFSPSKIKPLWWGIENQLMIK